MARLIDADWLKELYKPYESYNGKELAVPIGAILANIDDAPTIDAVSVVRGEWIESNLIKDGRIFICSNCNMAWVSKKRTMDGMNYCPNCGADMRKGADDE